MVSSVRSDGRSPTTRPRRFDSLAVVDDFDDLIAANRAFADDFDLGGFDGKAHAGIALVTCMDSRIDPLGCSGSSRATPRSFATPVVA